MTDEAKFDFTELTQLAADLGEVKNTIGPFLNSALQFTSVKVKKSAQKSVKGSSKRWKRLPSTITYDLTTFHGFGASVLKSEIGYDKEKIPGALGTVREFGAPAQNTAPGNDLVNALHENEADFQKGIDRAEIDAAKKVRLF